MIEIDRLALVIKPKKKFVDWLIEISDEPTLEEDIVDSDPTMILIPVFESDEELGEYIADNCRQWMEYEFASWCMNEKEWPEDRGLKQFQDMFELEIHSLVIDNVVEDYASSGEVTLQ